MRFCPFCSAENADEQAACTACGRRLPPLPPRRAGSKGQPTGIIMPPRAAPAPGANTPPPSPTRPKGSTVPPPVPTAPGPAATANAGSAAPAYMAPAPSAPVSRPNAATASAASTSTVPPPNETSPGFVPPQNTPPPQLLPRSDSTGVNRDSAPALPPPPAIVPGGLDTIPSAPAYNPAAQSLLDALSPGPAAERRPAAAPDNRIVGDRRGANPNPAATPPPSFDRSRSPSPGYDRPKTSSVPPAFDRSKSPSTGYDRPKTSSVPPPIPSRPGSQPGYISTPGSGPQRTPSPGAVGAPLDVGFGADTSPSMAPLEVETRLSTLDISTSRQTPTGLEPPPTRIHRADGAVDRPFTPPKVLPVPEIPEPGLHHAAKYAYKFGIARWQRRGAIKQLGQEIKQDTEALDQVLGLLGHAARGAHIEGRVFSAENTAISAAEERIANLNREANDVDGRKAEENSRFIDIEKERNEKLVEAERNLEEAQKELQNLEAQRRSLRDKRKELERRQKAFLKNADDHDRQAGAAPLGDQRQELRRAAEGHRKEAAALEPEKQEIDRRLGSLERPISEATARLDAAKAELDAAKRSLNDAREGHTHRLAELDAEHKRKSREVGLAEAEIQRRLVTLGTLVNLNRIEDPQFAELYQRIDRLRGAITARTTEIEKLTAEREAYDRGTLVRGLATIGGAFVVLIALIALISMAL